MDEQVCINSANIQPDLFVGIRQQSHDTSPLNSLGQLALMFGAVAGYPAGQDLAALSYILTEFGSIFIIDALGLVHAKAANATTAATVISAATKIAITAVISVLGHYSSSILRIL